jgi:hypothetical protein
MNCQEIARLLDEHDIGRLDSAARAGVASHIKTCAECATDWHAFERLHALTPADMPADYPPRLWREFDQSIPAARRPLSGRTVLFGGLLLVGAAAAMMLWQSAQEREPAPRATAISTSPTARPAPALTPIDESRAGSIAAQTATDAPPASADSSRDRLIVLPTEHQMLDPTEIDAVERARAVMLRVLASLPKLEVVEISQNQIDAADIADLPALNPFSPVGFGINNRQRNLLLAEHFGAEYVLNVVSFVQSGVGLPDRTTMRVSASMRDRSGSQLNMLVLGFNDDEPLDSRGAQFAREIYVTLFPNDALPIWESVLTDTGASDDERLAALHASAADTLARHSDAAIAAIVDLARSSPNPSTRSEVWRLLGQVTLAAIRQPLTDALLYDADPEVRRVAADSLYSYLPDPTISAALASVSASDTSADVRLQAQWSLMNANQRTSYVADALRDSSLSVERRVAPLLLSQRRYNTVLDAELLSILEEVGSRSADPRIRRAALAEFGRSTKPEWLPALLDALRSDADSTVRQAAARALAIHRAGAPGADARLYSEPLLEALLQDPEPAVRNATVGALDWAWQEPNVRAALESALANEIHPMVRDTIERALR